MEDVSIQHLLISQQRKFRRRLTVWLAETEAPPWQIGARCPTQRPWSTKSRDSLISFHLMSHIPWSKTPSSETILSPRSVLLGLRNVIISWKQWCVLFIVFYFIFKNTEMWYRIGIVLFGRGFWKLLSPTPYIWEKKKKKDFPSFMWRVR